MPANLSQPAARVLAQLHRLPADAPLPPGRDLRRRARITRREFASAWHELEALGVLVPDQQTRATRLHPEAVEPWPRHAC